MIILRYLSRDVLVHTAAIATVLLIIIFSGRFSKYLAQAAAGDMAVDVLLPIMFYRLPGFLELIVPLGLFIAILMAYGRLYVESEMTVMTACGISPWQFAAYSMVPAAIVLALVAALSLYVTPLGAARSQALLDDPASTQGLSTLTAGRFQNQDGGRLVSYVANIDGDTGLMRNIFVSQQGRNADGDPFMRVTVAKEGEFITRDEAGIRYFELRDGFTYDGIPGQLQYRVTEFERFGELIPQIEDGIRDTAAVDGRPTAALMGSDDLADIAALQWRISMPLMVPIVAVIALCLSKTNHRRGRYAKLLPALVIYVVYVMLLIQVRAAIESGDWPWQIGLWWIHVLYALLALGLLTVPQHFQQWRRSLHRA